MNKLSIEYSSPVIHIGIVVKDLERSMDFYQNILGMKKVDLYDIDSDLSKRTGLTGGIPFKIEVLKIEDSPRATEWKLMSFNRDSQHPQQKYIQDDVGVQYTTMFVNSLKPFVERFNMNNIQLLGDTPTKIDDQLSFILIQDPDGHFIEMIGPIGN